jgi:hypothetical protein
MTALGCSVQGVPTCTEPIYDLQAAKTVFLIKPIRLQKRLKARLMAIDSS